MAINLKKGQTIDLRKNISGKDVYSLSKVTLGLGWEGTSNSSKEADLDAIAFLLDENNKIVTLGKVKNLIGGISLAYQQSDIIFYNNMTFPSGSGTSAKLFAHLTQSKIEEKVQSLFDKGEVIVHTGDHLEGGGNGDDEQIIVKLDSLPERIHKIIFLVSIYQGIKGKQHFGQVKNAYIRACDALGKEIARYNLSETTELNGMCSLEFAELYKKNNTWKFRALGLPHKTDNFKNILDKYV